MKRFKDEFVAIFGNEYIYIGKYVIRPFSFAWWFILLALGAISAFVMYIFCLTIWVVFG